MTEASQQARLEPCPFCGGEASMFKARGEGPPYIPCCTKCSASLSLEWIEEEAERAWNTRLPATRRAEVLEADVERICDKLKRIGDMKLPLDAQFGLGEVFVDVRALANQQPTEDQTEGWRG